MSTPQAAKNAGKTVTYQQEPDLAVTDFEDVLHASTLAPRRPINDKPCLARMLANADIIVTARCEGKLVGISRAITDFAYCCYLSDLAVDEAYQKQGIGKKLIEETHKIAGLETSLILLSAPAAASYYHHIGMKPVDNGWVIPRTRGNPK